ncbi:MAG: ATP phosphoribosyltransferase, partial [Rhodoblastus sp.]|nr:ATP phosphoribosyltransferase [Rhodoblastus sp.]
TWDETAREAARLILARIAAEEEARTTREVRAFVPELSDSKLKKAAAKYGARMRGRGQEGLVMMACPKADAPDLAEWLIKHGAETVTVGQVDYVFTAKNALWEKLAKRLG